MVCDRCVMVVKDLFEKKGLHPDHVELGQVVLQEEISEEEKQSLSGALQQLGFEIMDDKKSRLIEKIKSIVIHWVRHPDADRVQNFSDLLAAKLHYDYNYLSGIFSEVEGITIEKYLIRQKIERAKELLVYDEHSLSQIADLLGYSSVAHLSSQFKQVTGFTASHFKKIREKRYPLDKL